MKNPELILELEGATKRLPNGTPLLKQIDLSLASGQSIALVGRSGSGKSTLLAMLGLLDRFDSGQYWLLGKEMGEMRSDQIDILRGTNIGFVFQRFSLIPHLTALENVMAPLRHSGTGSIRQMRMTAHENLERVFMDRMANKKPRHLSGGEQQRVAIARALVHGPRLILADEPTGSLDSESAASVMKLLVALGTSNSAGLIVVTHDNQVAERMQRTVYLDDGKLTTVLRAKA